MVREACGRTSERGGIVATIIIFIGWLATVLAGLGAAYFHGVSKGIDKAQTAHLADLTQATAAIRAVDQKAQLRATQEIQQHATEAKAQLEPTVNLDSTKPFDEAAAAELIRGAGVVVEK